MRQVMKRNVLFLLFAIKLRMNNVIFVDTYLGAKEWGKFFILPTVDSHEAHPGYIKR